MPGWYSGREDFTSQMQAAFVEALDELNEEEELVAAARATGHAADGLAGDTGSGGGSQRAAGTSAGPPVQALPRHSQPYDERTARKHGNPLTWALSQSQLVQRASALPWGTPTAPAGVESVDSEASEGTPQANAANAEAVHVTPSDTNAGGVQEPLMAAQVGADGGVAPAAPMEPYAPRPRTRSAVGKLAVELLDQVAAEVGGLAPDASAGPTVGAKRAGVDGVPPKGSAPARVVSDAAEAAGQQGGVAPEDVAGDGAEHAAEEEEEEELTDEELLEALMEGVREALDEFEACTWRVCCMT